MNIGTITFAPDPDGKKDTAPKGLKPLRFTVPNNRKTIFAKWDKVRVTPAEWLMLATVQDKLKDGTPVRNQLSAPHFDERHNTTVSADGFRCYIIRDEIRDLPGRLDPNDTKPFPDYTRIVPEPSADTARATVSTRDLLEAVQVLAPIASETMNTIRLRFDQDTLTLSAKSAELGDVSAEIRDGQDSIIRKETRKKLVYEYFTSVYRITGEPKSIAVNCRYLQDTLLGMSDLVEIQVTRWDFPMRLVSDVDGQVREAVLMPMYIEPEER